MPSLLFINTTFIFEINHVFIIILTLFTRYFGINNICENIDSLNGLDEETFSGLFRKYYEPLYFFAGRFVKDPSTAESLVQDVFVILWENKEKISIKTSVKAYLYTAVKNSCINFIKRENFFSSVENNDEYHDTNYKSPDSKLEEKEITTAIHTAINKLPEKCRQIFMMCKYDDLSYAEIAELQNISINTVKTQLKRAVKSLTKNLAHLRSFLIFIQFMFWWYLNK